MRFAMAVWAERNCVVRDIGPGVGEPTDVVDFQDGDAV